MKILAPLEKQGSQRDRQKKDVHDERGCDAVREDFLMIYFGYPLDEEG